MNQSGSALGPRLLGPAEPGAAAPSSGRLAPRSPVESAPQAVTTASARSISEIGGRGPRRTRSPAHGIRSPGTDRRIARALQHLTRQVPPADAPAL